MAVNLLDSIKQTECEADEILKKSHQQVRELINCAEQKRLEILQHAKEQSRQETIKALDKAEEEAKKIISGMNEKVDSECEEIKKQAQVNMERAVDTIVKRIVSAYGNS